MPKVARQYWISGRVQGVGYRYFAERVANQLRLDGWVRNLADGRVEALAAGSEARLSEFEGYLHQGPPHAEVRSVESHPAVPADAGRGFHIR